MKRWYVVRSKYRNEVLLWHQLCSRGIEAYFPRIYPQGMTTGPLGAAKPLFPGHMFVRVDLGAGPGLALLWMPGADGFVYFGGKPAFVSDGVLRAIQERTNQINRTFRGASVEPHSGAETGSESQPFARYRRIFEPGRPERERAAAFLRFIRDQQMPAESPMTASRCTKRYGAFTAVPYLSGLRRNRWNASRRHGNSDANSGEGLHLEAPGEEASPPS